MKIKRRLPLLAATCTITICLTSIPTAAMAGQVPVGDAPAGFSSSPGDVEPSGQIKTGAAVGIIPIILAVIAVGGGVSTMGTDAAKKVYYAGLRNPEYQRIKWQVRTAVFAALGPVLGAIFMVGFENQFYSMI